MQMYGLLLGNYEAPWHHYNWLCTIINITACNDDPCTKTTRTPTIIIIHSIKQRLLLYSVATCLTNGSCFTNLIVNESFRWSKLSVVIHVFHPLIQWVCVMLNWQGGCSATLCAPNKDPESAIHEHQDVWISIHQCQWGRMSGTGPSIWTAAEWVTWREKDAMLDFRCPTWINSRFGFVSGWITGSKDYYILWFASICC